MDRRPISHRRTIAEADGRTDGAGRALVSERFFRERKSAGRGGSESEAGFSGRRLGSEKSWVRHGELFERAIRAGAEHRDVERRWERDDPIAAVRADP